MKKTNNGELILYKDKRGEIELEVKFSKKTVWLTQKEMSNLFNKDVRTINEHIGNIFKEKELEKKSVIRKFRITAADGKSYESNLYSLDVVISVGYRVKSQQGVRFRIWATNILRNHLINGYTLNKQRLLFEKEKLEKLQKAIAFLNEKAHAKILQGQELEILNILADYSKTFSILEQYDKNNLQNTNKNKAWFILTYEDCEKNIATIKKALIVKKEAGNIFGVQRSGSFEGIVKNLYQTFAKKELYASLESKAAHLLYLTIKDHPFSDGNKRIAAFLFVHFLNMNKYLFKNNGERKINDNALAALALLIAESDPKEKDQMIALITQLIK